MPDLDLLDDSDAREHRIDYDELSENKQILLDKLATYNIEITSIEAIVGPTVTMYELTPAPGIKISRITALENDLAMALAARGIRMIAPIPGKSAIGVEIPNRHRELVRIRDIIGTARFSKNKMQLPLILGKSIEGETVLEDLSRMPHVLIAGATGSGKSVGLNTFIAGLLFACPPSLLKFVMIDPKKIELAAYANIASHYVAMPPEASEAIITDVDQALGTLRSCEKEMERRYDLLSEMQVRSLKEYNTAVEQAGRELNENHEKLPYIVIIVDELADLMMTAGKDIEAPIARLAQMARAVGIHLILATQRPSVDVITGLIKANFPSRIAYQVASKIDSRTILDQNGAEGLVGNGDMLYMSGSRITRLQGPFVSIEEVDRITTFIGAQHGEGPYLLPSLDLGEGSSSSGSISSADRDDLFKEAAHIIVRSQQGSVSLLQRKLSVGYARAARLIDQLEDAGIVGPFEGSKARQVLVEDEMQLDQLLAATG
jgi:S-DNA-T family DNA segregation ATPase FtsK/SpoIIIE